MKSNQNQFWKMFVNAETDEDLAALGEKLGQGGYSLFNEFLHQLKREITAALEEEMQQLKRWIAKGRTVLPEPVRLSPSWEGVWDDYERIVAYKEEVLFTVPNAERKGEWQVVINNPFTHEPVACYPALSFNEAAYLFAYFRKDVKPNENLRLQKIVDLLTVHGN